MTEANPIELLFGGMEKLGPGSNADTLQVLGMLPKQPYQLVVDAGCGSGRQSLALVSQLRTLVHAVDSYEPFLNSLVMRAEEARTDHLIQTHCMDIADIANTFQDIDLLWSEGAAYNIGFPNALNAWYRAVKPNGLVVVSELSWIREEIPTEARQFFETAYPGMRSTDENRSAARKAGYKVLNTHTLPEAAWIDGYYEILGPRAKALLEHPDESVRDFAAEAIEEIRIFGCSEGSYGYVFYIMQKA